MVFDGGGDDVVAGAGAAQGVGDAEEGGIDALGAAAREEDLGGASVEAIGDRLAGSIHDRLGFAPGRIESAGVAEAHGEVGKHRLKCFGPERSGGGVVEVDHENQRSRRA